MDLNLTESLLLGVELGLMTSPACPVEPGLVTPRGLMISPFCPMLYEFLRDRPSWDGGGYRGMFGITLVGSLPAAAPV